ncbi:MAG: hypothetical protein AAGE52_00490 [Myxococcota bacterium]
MTYERLGGVPKHLALCLALLACGGTSSRDAEVDVGDAPEGPLRQFLVGGITVTPDGSNAFGVVVSELSLGVDIDLGSAAVFAGRPSVAVSPDRDGVVWIGLDEEPVVERYEVGADGFLELVDRMSVAGLGLSSGRGTELDGIQILSPQKAYLIDAETLQVVVFDPTEMELLRSFSLEGLAREGRGFIDIVRDGERIVIVASTFRADDTADLETRAAFVDLQTDEVRYASQGRCGNLAWSARDSDGNLYFASHPQQGADVAVGTAGDPPSPPCLVRIRAGEAGFDEGYFVDLRELAGGPAGAVVQAGGGWAYTLVYDESRTPLTIDNVALSTLLAEWRYFAFRLGDEAEGGQRIESIRPSSGIGLGFSVNTGIAEVPMVTIPNAGFARSTVYDVSDPLSFERRMLVPGLAFGALRVR